MKLVIKGQVMSVTEEVIKQLVQNTLLLIKYRRQDILRRDGYKCCLCDGYANVVHHIDGNTLNNNPHNLITVCSEDHARTQQEDLEKRLKKMALTKNGVKLFGGGKQALNPCF